MKDEAGQGNLLLEGVRNSLRFSLKCPGTPLQILWPGARHQENNGMKVRKNTNRNV